MPTLRLARPLASLRPSRLLSQIADHVTLARSRRGLLRLDDHLLRDIGLTRDQALDEARRVLWDAPAHWRS